MYQDLETGYSITHSGLESVVVEYFSDTTTCADKMRLWEAIDFKKRFARDCNSKPEDIGMVKTILFSYLRQGQEKYFLVSTLAEKKVDLNEIQLELGLSAAEAQSINHKLSDAAIETITGKKRGIISPLLDPEYVQKVDAVYFARDLIKEAISAPEKKYDLPRSLTVSEFWNAAVLFTSLEPKGPKYKTAGNFENEAEISDLWIKKIDPEKAGYNFLFSGTIVKYRGQEYQITNPPLKKEGIDRKRKQIDCTAFPISRTEEGKILYHYTDRGRKRIMLSFTYEILAKRIQP